MAVRDSNPVALAKAILWEEAKGKLRALVAADGATFPTYPEPPEGPRFKIVSNAVEDFISDFEADGLHE